MYLSHRRCTSLLGSRVIRLTLTHILLVEAYTAPFLRGHVAADLKYYEPFAHDRKRRK